MAAPRRKRKKRDEDWERELEDVLFRLASHSDGELPTVEEVLNRYVGPIRIPNPPRRAAHWLDEVERAGAERGISFTQDYAYLGAWGFGWWWRSPAPTERR